MPKSNRRVTFTRTITYTFTTDVTGKPEETDANLLTYCGGAAGTSGVLSIGELLSWTITANGVVSKGSWAATGTSSNVEPIGVRTASLAMALGDRITSINPPSGYEAAKGMVFVVTVAGTTGSGSTEPNWNVSTLGGTTTDGTVTFRTMAKFPTITTYAQSTVYATGTVLRPSTNSLKEFLVVTQNSAAASTPTWTASDTLGSVVAFQTGGSAICIAGVKTYALLSLFALGDVVESSAGDGSEYLCTQAGTTDTTALSTTVGASVTRGSATFKRIV